MSRDLGRQKSHLKTIRLKTSGQDLTWIETNDPMNGNSNTLWDHFGSKNCFLVLVQNFSNVVNFIIQQNIF